LSSKRLEPSGDFTRKYFFINYSKRMIVKSAIKSIENDSPSINLDAVTGRRFITHSGCKLYFRNDSLLDFEFF